MNAATTLAIINERNFDLRCFAIRGFDCEFIFQGVIEFRKRIENHAWSQTTKFEKFPIGEIKQCEEDATILELSQ